MLGGHSEQVDSVVFSPDGKTMASAGSTILLWELTDLMTPLRK